MHEAVELGLLAEADEVGAARARAPPPPSSSAWPQYRKDVLRSNATEMLPASSNPWDVSLGGRLTAPTSDNIRLYLGHDDEVLALMCSDGKVAWRSDLRNQLQIQ